MPKPISQKKKTESWTVEIQTLATIYDTARISKGNLRVADLIMIRGGSKELIEKLRQAGFEITKDR